MGQTSEALVLDSTPRERLGRWLKSFIGEYRRLAASLSEEEQRFVQRLDDFSTPCQIDVIWLQPPDVQYLIVTRFNNRPDLEITINGPFPTYDAVDKLENILEESRWNRPLPENDHGYMFTGKETFRDIVDWCFVDIVRGLRVLPYQKPLDRVSSSFKSLLTSEAFFWSVRGDLSNLDAFKLAQEMVEGARNQAKASKLPQPSIIPGSQTVIQASGSFIFPPVWVGDEPKPSFRERALGGYLRFPLTVFNGSYKGRMIVASDDGFVAIAETDRSKATALLNEIMAVRLLEGKPTFSFREQEVEGATIDADTKQIGSMGVPSLSVRASLMEERWNSQRLPVYGERDVVSLDEIKAWIDQANKITQDIDLADSLRFLLEAYTHFQDSRYLESFVLSWVVVEKHLYAIWQRFLKDEGVPSARRRKLQNTASWTTDSIIETLSLLKQLRSEEYSKLMSLKSLRNDIIHEGDKVSKEQAQQVLNEATQILAQKIVTPQAATT